ncbi:MAG: site-specific integrase [Mariprofundaceae bacterium]|nr:site-specific integrase [Mariprofundaceae bacterium]
MSKIYKRKNRDGTYTFHVSISIKGIDRVRETTGIRSDEPEALNRAKEYLSRRETELWREAKFGERPQYLWEEAVLKWLEENAHKKSLHTDESRLKWLYPHLKGVRLADINRDVVEKLMRKKEKDNVSAATINRHAALIRSILYTACHEWGWIDAAPKIRMRPENNDKITWATEEEMYNIILPQIAANDGNADLVDAVEFTLNTGLREQNACQLQWQQVFLDAGADSFMSVYETKNGEPLTTPLNSRAVEILRRQIGRHPQRVFTYNGRPRSNLNTSAYKKAIRRAMVLIREQYGYLPERLEEFNWHSLRHTWATWMAMKGCPLAELQKLGGWKKPEMAMRYMHFNMQHLGKFSELIAKTRPNLKVVNS